MGILIDLKIADSNDRGAHDDLECGDGGGAGVMGSGAGSGIGAEGEVVPEAEAPVESDEAAQAPVVPSPVPGWPKNDNPG